MKPLQLIILLFFLSHLMGCGGGTEISSDDQSQGDNQDGNQNQDDDDQTNTDDNSDGGNDDSNGDNNGNDNNNDDTLVRPVLSSTINDGQVTFSWTNANATQYRLLYWQGNNSPTQSLSENLSVTLSLSSGTYMSQVEAYDALGNSLFSVPVEVEVH